MLMTGVAWCRLNWLFIRKLFLFFSEILSEVNTLCSGAAPGGYDLYVMYI